MAWEGAGMTWVWAGTECSRTNRERRCLTRVCAGGHEYSLWFVGLCRIVSISVDGGMGAVLRELDAAGGIPAFAGMTWEGAGMAWVSVVVAWEGAVVAWEGAVMAWEGAVMAWVSVVMA